MHQTPENTAEAIAIQQELRRKVTLEDDSSAAFRLIAGIDVGYSLRENLSRAAIVLMDFPSLNVRATAIADDPTPFPYIPGLLSFRETPAILNALSKLDQTPDLLIIDGHGIAHPRRLGIAAHIGVLTGITAIGVAKKRLCGAYTEPGREKGELTLLRDEKTEERIGTVLRSRDGVKPLFVSPGHRVSHDYAVEIVMACLKGYRLPEPTRQADKLSKFR